MDTPPPSDEFDPFALRSDASLNRTTLAAIRGANERWVGHRAFDFLSLGPLKRLCAEHGFADGPDAGLAAVAKALTSNRAGSDETARARAVCHEYGRRLAHLIASLITPGASAPWSPWRAAYLDYWATIDHVWLGGGIPAALGSELLHSVREEFARLDAGQCEIEIPPNPGALAVIGCARSRANPHPHAIALDFGHSSVKRGVAIVNDGALVLLQQLPRLDVPSLESDPSPELVRDLVLETIADTYRSAQRRYDEIDPRLVVSLATYLTNGLPVDVYSLYRPLSGLTLDYLQSELHARTGAVVQLSFLHDGTAAARALHARGRDAVIMVGTSLGVGFLRPASAGLLPMSADLVVDEVSPL